MRKKGVSFTFCLIIIIILLISNGAVFVECSELSGTSAEVPPTTATTPKTGFFGGIKNFFRGTTTTTTTPITPTPTAQQRLTPITVPNVPLMPLGPRPDTPPTAPLYGVAAPQPAWPNTQSSTTPAAATASSSFQRPTGKTPQTFGNLEPGFGYARPVKGQPNGFDLSYGGPSIPAVVPTKPTTTATTTTTTTVKPQTSVNRPTAVKEDFPLLPTPKSPIGAGAPTNLKPTPAAGAGSSSSSSMPSVWGNSQNPWQMEPLKPAALPTNPSAPTQLPAAPSPKPVAPIQPGSTALPGAPQQPNSPVKPTTPAASNSNQLATDSELKELTESLFSKEAGVGELITTDLQGKTRSIDKTDEAPEPLLRVPARALESHTISKMRALFNNYEADTLTNEHVTPNERIEENEFIDAVLGTNIMRQTMLFLQKKGIVTADPRTHRELLKELWFTQYSRGQGRIGSSGFEHVFVHEVKNGTIIGFHNWVYLKQEEEANRLNYQGWMKTLDLGTKAKIVKIRFTHKGLVKPVNSVFIGTSPELELALYTLCFKVRPELECPVSLGNNRFNVVTYKYRYRGKDLIGSAFPEI